MILSGIINSWEKKSDLSEFEKDSLFAQSDSIANILFANIGNIDENLLKLQIDFEQLQLSFLNDSEKKESALEILKNRIRLSSAFLEINKYTLAKYVVEENTAELFQNLDETSQSIQNYLILLKKEVDTKIAYIEDNLH